ncbi:Maf1-domain-containing protein [Sistotremastrum niveocremeum HHB9708]|uniref:Maf1-domain-containing protein n=1 Tax=Sistotremastrum niveocremeum HHB9708 TaxID=1314777 RepID=A0A164TVY9_9AGAM|nr:Maf1-domain-containing protein [Sistotremastrum niveocremeum HHB9708]
MKYLELPELASLSRMLTHNSNECIVHTRLEAYSCKAITKDKRMYRHLEHSYHAEEFAQSPPYLAMEREPEMTVFGPMDKHASRKTLYLLIATLNHAFPDHDFSDLRPDNFSREENGAAILNALSTTLMSLTGKSSSVGTWAPRTYSAYPPSSHDFFPASLPTSSSPPSHIASPFAPPPIMSGTHPTLYKMLDDIIKLDDCDVYTYNPDMHEDPHAGDSDDEDDWVDSDDDSSSVASAADELFDFFDDDDTAKTASRNTSRRQSQPWDTDDEQKSPVESSSPSSRIRNMKSRRHGGLLWSSNFFFFNKKQKRMLFVTTWARKKNPDSLSSSVTSDRFAAWDGALGAGARALGLSLSDRQMTRIATAS